MVHFIWHVMTERLFSHPLTKVGIHFGDVRMCATPYPISWIIFIIGINHGFQCSNIQWITRKVFEHKAAGRVFKHLPSDPANV